MKTRFSPHVLIALTMAVGGAVGFTSWAGESTASITQTQTGDALPEDIQPGTPAAQVVKLAQAGVDNSVIQNYITNCPSAFNLNADKIIALSDAGVSGDMINAMIAHDKNFLASLPMAEPPATTSSEAITETNTAETATTPPPEPVDVNYFYNTLNPYGSWVNIDGYGLCWRPTVVVYNSGWRPYCDRGHWVYTDCGWYWDSDYAWGITFHYGRWFNSPRYGWCWWPDTVWAPSWVTWRSSVDYCGWAPLPPFAAYQPGIGFTYHGKNVAVSFGFGLASSCFTFVSAGHFCDPQPWHYRVAPHEVNTFYGRTVVCNNFDWHDRRIVNHGVSVTIIGSATRHPIHAVPIGSLVNVNRHGWHYPGVRPSEHHEYHPVGTSHPNYSERRNFGGNDHRQNVFPHNGNNNNRGHNEHLESPKPSSPAADRPDNRHENHNSSLTAPAGYQTRNAGLANNGNHRPTGQSQTHSAAVRPHTPVITTTVPRPSKPNVVPTQIVRGTPSRSEIHGQVSVQQQRSPSRPTITVGQPQRSNPRNNIVQVTPHHTSPSASSAPMMKHNESGSSNSPNNNGRHQEWASRDGGHH